MLKALLIILLISPLLAAHGDSWKSITGAEKLRELIAGATAEFEISPGVLAKGEYFPDGTAKIQVYGGTIRRTWDIRGEDQVCYSADIEREVKCYRFEQSVADPTQFRAINAATGEIYVIRVLDEATRTYARETLAGAKGSFSTPSAAELAAELANPNTSLGTMNFFFDYTAFQGSVPGADTAESTRLTFQPSMPYPLTDTANFFFRPLFPLIIDQDVPGANGVENKEFEFGDISYDMAVFNTAPSGFIYGGGIAGSIPTASDDAVGTDQWLLGPELILAVMKPWGALGIIASHQWDVAGDDDFETSITAGQYFYSFNIKDGWVFGAGPTFSYNHKANGGNKLTLPIGLGGSKTLILGGRPWRIGLQYWYYAESPDAFGAEHQLRLQIAPVIKLPW